MRAQMPLPPDPRPIEQASASKNHSVSLASVGGCTPNGRDERVRLRVADFYVLAAVMPPDHIFSAAAEMYMRG